MFVAWGKIVFFEGATVIAEGKFWKGLGNI
jgi:hypothetical protein